MTELYLDLETYSEAPLPKVGAYRYAEHPSTEIILVGWALGDQPVQLWRHGEPRPDELISALDNTSITKWAHNAAFDRVVLHKCWDRYLHPGNWRCSMVWANALTLPPALGNLAVELRLVEGKLDEGKKLIKKFSIPPGKPDTSDPEWADFERYCRRDVEVMRACIQRMSRYPMPESEWQLYQLDQQINDRGLPIDSAFVSKALEAVMMNRGKAYEAAQATTELANPNSRDQMLGWLREQGVPATDLRKGTVSELLQGDIPESVRNALEARQQLAASSLSKYETLDVATCDDRRLRGTFQFYGAHTGRWSGRLFQPQNLPRGTVGEVDELETARAATLDDADWLCRLYGDVSGTLSSLVRTAIAAPAGKKLVVADYASIETVMLAWACERGRLWEVLQQGRDVYRDFGTRLFDTAYDDITKAQRTLAKPAVLGCGYLLGAKGLQGYASGFGLALVEEEAQRQVNTYRKTYPEVPRFWWTVQNAAFKAVTDNTEATVGAFTFRFEKPYLWIDLPSGRSLSYYRPRIEMRMKPWGEPGPTLTYQSAKFGRISTHPGKITENIIQAIARDVLAWGLHKVETAPSNLLETVGTVHDEIICVADADDDDALPFLEVAMDAPPWCRDAPIGVEGWEGGFYRKA